MAFSYAYWDNLDTRLASAWELTDNSVRVIIQNTLGCCGFSEFNVDIGDPCPDSADQECLGLIQDQINSYFNIVGPILVVIAVIEVSSFGTSSKSISSLELCPHAVLCARSVG